MFPKNILKHFQNFYIFFMSRVNKENGYGLGDKGSISYRGRNFTSEPVLGHTQPPI
jgi:hypothetical protein